MKKTLIWIGALIVGALLGLLGLGWLNTTMDFIATVYTRLFQLLAVPTIVLAVITTFATFGSQGSGRIFGRTLTYTLLTTFAAATNVKKERYAKMRATLSDGKSSQEVTIPIIPFY